jgi:hypothetical protein
VQLYGDLGAGVLSRTKLNVSTIAGATGTTVLHFLRIPAPGAAGDLGAGVLCHADRDPRPEGTVVYIYF